MLLNINLLQNLIVSIINSVILNLVWYITNPLLFTILLVHFGHLFRYFFIQYLSLLNITFCYIPFWYIIPYSHSLSIFLTYMIFYKKRSRFLEYV